MARSPSSGEEARPGHRVHPRAAQAAQLYRELLEITRATLAWLREAAVPLATPTDSAAARWQARVRHHLPLIEQIVLAGEPVPAGDKLVSLFEPHADIIVKGSREVEYGHKLNLTTGKSGLIWMW